MPELPTYAALALLGGFALIAIGSALVLLGMALAGNK